MIFKGKKIISGLLALLFAGTMFFAVAACKKAEPPVKVGFIGCLTGRSADLGIAGRDGFLLAVQEKNVAGGIAGRQIVPVVRDDALDAEAGKQALQELFREGVSFVVGPMTSELAINLVPLANAAAVPLISPTVSTNKLIGVDDYFFRVYYANSQAAVAMAAHIGELGLKKVAVLYDTRNRAYTEDWVRIFSNRFAVAGRSVELVPFTAATAGTFEAITADLKSKGPDGLLILANSIDTALICQQAYKLELKIPRFATGWSYGSKLTTYGGKSVEGLVVVQSVNLKKERAETRLFVDAFRAAYFADPTFPAVHAFDATRLGLMALEGSGGERSLKEQVLSIDSFPGVVQNFSLDEFGDVVNPPIYFMEIDEAVLLAL